MSSSSNKNLSMPFISSKQQMQSLSTKKTSYFLQFAYTKEKKYVLPFSRRIVDIDLQSLIDQYQTSLLIRYGIWHLLYDYGPPDSNKKVIRLFDETYQQDGEDEILKALVAELHQRKTSSPM